MQQQLGRANRAAVTHEHGSEHPFSSPRLRFWRSFGLDAVSLSPSNLIGKPQACHSVSWLPTSEQTASERKTPGFQRGDRGMMSEGGKR